MIVETDLAQWIEGPKALVPWWMTPITVEVGPTIRMNDRTVVGIADRIAVALARTIRMEAGDRARTHPPTEVDPTAVVALARTIRMTEVDRAATLLMTAVDRAATLPMTEVAATLQTVEAGLLVIKVHPVLTLQTVKVRVPWMMIEVAHHPRHPIAEARVLWMMIQVHQQRGARARMPLMKPPTSNQEVLVAQALLQARKQSLQ